jgi:uncharacterized membrane protein YbaN (DUF454 family)
VKWLFFLIAWISCGLGFIGVFIPILPTTPFLILAAFLFSKSSPRFHAWLMSIPVAGDGVRDWQANRTIKPKAKILCVSMLLLSFFLIWNSPKILTIIKSLVTLLLIGVGAFVVSRKSYSK